MCVSVLRVGVGDWVLHLALLYYLGMMSVVSGLWDFGFLMKALLNTCACV